MLKLSCSRDFARQELTHFVSICCGVGSSSLLARVDKEWTLNHQVIYLKSFIWKRLGILMHRKGSVHLIPGILCSVVMVGSEMRKRGWQEPERVTNTPWLHRDDAGAQGPTPAVCGLLWFGSKPPLSLWVASPQQGICRIPVRFSNAPCGFTARAFMGTQRVSRYRSPPWARSDVWSLIKRIGRAAWAGQRFFLPY